MNNDLIRLERIKKERKELLESIREQLKNSNDNFSEDLSKIMLCINLDDGSIKKYEAIIKSQDLVTNLIIEVLNCSTKEDVLKLRNKINYLINKIKKELENRNISEKDINLYKDKIKDVRKDISSFVRYLKRNDTISEIESLIERYNDLNKDELKRLKKLLKNERSYNSRILREKNRDSKKEENSDLHEVFDIPPKKKDESKFDFSFINAKKDEEKTDIEDLGEVFDIPSKQNDESKFDFSFINLKKDEEKTVSKDLGEVFGIPPKQNEEFKFDFSLEENDTKSTQEKTSDKGKVKGYLLQRANKYRNQYYLQDTYEYNSSVLGNIASLIKNIPIYISNNFKLRHMQKDSKTFYMGSDLISYVAYTKKRNSILTGLKSIFNKSYLFNGEGVYLNIHNNCSEWLYNYCLNNNLSVKSFM